MPSIARVHEIPGERGLATLDVIVYLQPVCQGSCPWPTKSFLGHVGHHEERVARVVTNLRRSRTVSGVVAFDHEGTFDPFHCAVPARGSGNEANGSIAGHAPAVAAGTLHLLAMTRAISTPAEERAARCESRQATVDGVTSVAGRRDRQIDEGQKNWIADECQSKNTRPRRDASLAGAHP